MILIVIFDFYLLITIDIAIVVDEESEANRRYFREFADNKHRNGPSDAAAKSKTG